LAAGAPRPARPLSRRYHCSLIPSVAPARRASGPLLRSHPRRPLCKSPSDAFDHHRGFDPMALARKPSPGRRWHRRCVFAARIPSYDVAPLVPDARLLHILPRPHGSSPSAAAADRDGLPFRCRVSLFLVRPTHSGDKPCLAGSAASAVRRRVGSMVVSRRRCLSYPVIVHCIIVYGSFVEISLAAYSFQICPACPFHPPSLGGFAFARPFLLSASSMNTPPVPQDRCPGIPEYSPR
jgi:hypothetical protein